MYTYIYNMYEDAQNAQTRVNQGHKVTVNKPELEYAEEHQIDKYTHMPICVYLYA